MVCLRRLRILTGAYVVLACPPQTDAQEGARLSWTSPEGRSSKEAPISYEVQQESVESLPVGGREFVMRTRFEVFPVWESYRDKEGNQVWLVSIKRVRISLSGLPGLRVNYDTDAPDNSSDDFREQLALLNSLVQRKRQFWFRMDARGLIPETLHGPDELVAGLDKAESLDIIGNFLTKQNLRLLTGIDVLRLPDVPLAKMERGQTWSSEPHRDTMPNGGTEIVRFSYTYDGAVAGRDDRLVKIGIRVQKDYAGSKGEKPKIRVREQESSGAVYFDLAKRRIESLELHEKLQLAVNSLGNEFDQETKTTTLMKRTDEAISDRRDAPIAPESNRDGKTLGPARVKPPLPR